MMTIEAAQLARAQSHLAKPIIVSGKLTTLRGMVDILKAEGYTLRSVNVPKVKPLSRMAFFRADRAKQDAHERRMKEAGTKLVWEAHHEDGSIFDLTATQAAYWQAN